MNPAARTDDIIIIIIIAGVGGGGLVSAGDITLAVRICEINRLVGVAGARRWGA